MLLYNHTNQIKAKQRTNIMGYITYVSDIDMPDIDGAKLTPAKMRKFKEAMEQKNSLDKYWDEGIQDTLEFFLGYELDEDDRVIRFEEGGDSGKAYVLVEAVEQFAKLLQRFGIVFSGSFVMYGEESGDIKKVVILDNKVEVKEAKITFD